MHSRLVAPAHRADKCEKPEFDTTASIGWGSATYIHPVQKAANVERISFNLVFSVNERTDRQL
jgi:hypothetical protein